MLEQYHNLIIPITLILTFASLGMAIFKKNPVEYIIPLLIFTFGVYVHLEIRNEKLNKAIAANQPIECGENVYYEYEIKGDFLVAHGSSFNIKNGECFPLESQN